MAARIRACLAADPYDVVITSELSTAAYAESFAGYAALFDDIELGILHEHPSRVTTARQRLRHRLTWYKHRRYLAALLPRFAACTVVSEQERHLLRSAVVAPPPITLIPNAVRVSDYADVSAVRHPTRLIYTGALTYAANDDAVRWFLSDIYPKIRAVVPEVELMVTGELGNQTLPAQPSVCFTGRVDDVRPLLASAAVSIVPLRIGAGTRLKILEAMVLGTPVVATTKGAEGLTLVDGEDLLIGDDPASFAQQVIRVLRDASLGQRLAQHAAVKVRNDYDWATLGPRFEALVREIALVGA
jgi:glycosyltransferase involved in cell wall biosynthesis